MALAALALLAAAALLAGCAQTRQEIPASPVQEEQADTPLGPGVRPLSSGLGDKSSPSWGPEGERIAFIVDGYAVEKPARSGGERRRLTAMNFGAERAEWLSPSSLVMRRTEPTSVEPETGSVYITNPADSARSVDQEASDTLTITPASRDGGVIAAIENESSDSFLARLRGRDGEDMVYDSRIEGLVTGLSLSPDGGKAVLCVREDDGGFALHAFDLSEGTSRQLARLEEGLEILGPPQWTGQGIYYVAGEEPEEDDEGPIYRLYRLPPGSGEPELAPGVGEDFVTSGIRVSPGGGHLAVIGRRSSGSSANLYILDPATQELLPATSNQNMEIKSAPGDLAWSPDSESVVIVARRTLSGPRVYPEPAESLRRPFYNLYEVAATGLEEEQ